MKEYFNFLGFKINTKKFLITMAIFAAVVIVLVIVDLLLFRVSWYGFLIGCAFLLAVVIACELMPERGLRKDLPYDLIWWVFPLSIIGARIAFVINNVDLYNNFWEMCAVWNGGLSIYGGVIGGAIGLVICCAIKKVDPIKAMDCVAPVLILGQAIGRWGNFANMEVYGWEITNDALKWFPFGVKVNGTWHLANFFYESVLDLAGFFMLLYLLRKTKKKGLVTCSYLCYYGFIRFFLEDLRDPQFIMIIPGTNIAWSKLTSLITFLIGAIGLITILIITLVNKKKLETANILNGGAIENKADFVKTETELNESEKTKTENKNDLTKHNKTQKNNDAHTKSKNEQNKQEVIKTESDNESDNLENTGKWRKQK